MEYVLIWLLIGFIISTLEFISFKYLRREVISTIKRNWVPGFKFKVFMNITINLIVSVIFWPLEAYMFYRLIKRR